MSSKYLSGTYASGYLLTGVYSSITIGTTGSISGIGLVGGTNAEYAIVNLGRIVNDASGTSTSGVMLQAGGSIVNGTTSGDTALISGASFAPTAMAASGAGIDLSGGGSITNWGTVTGGGGAPFGQPFSHVGGAGINLSDGGSITNWGTVVGGGGGGNPGGSYQGGTGIDLSGGGSITNWGTVVGGGAGGYGIMLSNAGNISNWGVVAAGGGGLSTGGAGIGIVLLAGGSISNWGTVAGGGGGQGHFGPIAGGDGIRLLGAGFISNRGTVSGATAASGINAGGTIDNWGMIAGGYGAAGHGTPGFAGAGINLSGGGSITNWGTVVGGQGGRYGGAGGVAISVPTGGNVINLGTVAGGAAYAGTIVGSAGTAIVLSDGGIVANGTLGGTALIAGGSGLQATGPAGATIINYGTIIGSNGVAVSFGGGGGNLLVLGSGSQVIGVIEGSAVAGATDTLELRGSAGSAVTVDYNGLGLTNFETVLFGTGGNATLLVSTTSGTLGVNISGFDTTSEVIDLTGIGADGTVTNFDTATDRITVTGSGGSVTLQFDTIDNFIFTTTGDGGSGTDLSIACFLRGTLILTDRGEVAVETLSIGDRVMTFSGAACPIKWIGHRAYDGRFIRGNRQVLPIRIAAGAIADGVPSRVLWLSPEHSLYIDGVLVRAMHLLNGVTITQPDAANRVEYFHIELDEHDVIFAEGASAETYVNCDNRLMFQNGAEFIALHPQDDRPRWAFCAPRLEESSHELAAIRAGLLARAEGIGFFSRDPELHLMVDGAAVLAHSVENGVYRFTVEAGAHEVRIASRNAMPAETEASSLDRRRLGVPVKHIVLYGADRRIKIGPECASLCDGFHADEGSHRWTDGNALLPSALLAAFTGDLRIEVKIVASELRYPLNVLTDSTDAQAGRRTRLQGRLRPQVGGG